jgi:hypothetical protein
MSEGSRAAGRPVRCEKRRRRCALLARVARVALACFAAQPCLAQAGSGPVSIDWNAPAGCPSYADVASWLDAVLPPEVKARLDSARAAVTIERVASPGAGFRAVVRVQVGEEVRERTLEGTACDELGRSAMIIVSVALTEVVNKEPESNDPSPAAPAPAPAGPVHPAPRPSATAPRPTTPPRNDPPTAVLSLGGGVSSGFGSPALRVDLAARWQLVPILTLGARVHAVPAATLETGGRSIDLTQFAAGPEGCLTTSSETLHVGGCLRAEIGVLRASGSGATGLHDGAVWSAVGMLPFVEWGGSLRVFLAGDLNLRLLRPTLELADGSTVERLPRFGYAGLLGFSAAVP